MAKQRTYLWLLMAGWAASLRRLVGARRSASPTDPGKATDPKADCESLLNALAPFATAMLSKQGEFYPFGGVMKPDGEIVFVAGWDGEERPPSTELIASIKEGFVVAARRGEYKATALAYDVRVAVPGSAEKSDAVAVSMNHRDDYSAMIYLPYKLEAGAPVFGEVIGVPGEGDIFPAMG